MRLHDQLALRSCTFGSFNSNTNTSLSTRKGSCEHEAYGASTCTASQGVEFVNRITPSSKESEDIDKATKTRFVSKCWHEGRYCWTKFVEIKTRPAMLYKNSLPISSSAALIWGRDHESQEVRVGGGVSKNCELLPSTHKGYLGASPDGLVYFGGVCIEIKCP